MQFQLALVALRPRARSPPSRLPRRARAAGLGLPRHGALAARPARGLCGGTAAIESATSLTFEVEIEVEIEIPTASAHALEVAFEDALAVAVTVEDAGADGETTVEVAATTCRGGRGGGGGRRRGVAATTTTDAEPEPEQDPEPEPESESREEPEPKPEPRMCAGQSTRWHLRALTTFMRAHAQSPRSRRERLSDPTVTSLRPTDILVISGLPADATEDTVRTAKHRARRCVAAHARGVPARRRPLPGFAMRPDADRAVPDPLCVPIS